MFKTCLIAFGNVFWAFWKNESFPVFWSYSTCRPSRVHWAFLFQKTYLKTSWKLVWTILGTFLDTFEIPKLFQFFFEFFPSFDLQGALGKKRMGEKITSKINLDTFGNVFRDFENLNFFPFFEIFRFLDPPGCTGRSFLPEKTPRSMLKTCLNTFGNVFGHFEKMKVFQFFEVFPSLDLPGCTGQFFLRRLPQNKFETCLDTFKNVLDTFEKSNFFSIFLRIFTKFDLQVALGKKISEEITSSKFGHFWKGFWGFWNFEIFSIFVDFFLSLLCALDTAFSVEKLNQNILKQCFWEHFRTNLKVWKFFVFLKFFPSLDPPRCTGDFFLKQNYLKTGSEHVWTILGTVLDTLEILNFSIFSNLSLTRPPRVHCAKFLPKKLPRNMFKTCLIAFGNVFWAFWKIEGFSSFLEFFQVSTLQGALGNFFRKNHLKTSSKLVWTLLGKFLDTFEFSNFFDFFFDFFQVSTLKGALVNLFLPKKLAQSMFKTCLNFLGNVFGHFEKKWKFFLFSDVFPCFDPPGCTGQYFFPEKNLKTSSTLVWKLLRTFLDTLRNSIFSIFFRISASFDLQGALVKKSSKKISSKQIWTLLEMFFGILKKWDLFPFFWIFFDFSTLQDALGEIFHRKKYLEACWKHVWTLLGTYLGILKKWKFSSFLKFFPVWTFQGALGSFFRENYLKTSSKLVWTLLRTFWTLLRNQFFFVFSSNFYKIRSPGCTGQENFGKKYLK